MITNIRSKAEALAEANALLNRKPFTREDRSKYDALLAMADQLTDPEKKDELRRGAVESLERELHGTPEVRVSATSEYDRRFYGWMRSGQKHDREAMLAALPEEVRISYTPQSTVSSGGGYLAPQGFNNAVIEVVKQVDPLYAASTLVPTPRGNAFNHPVVDDPYREAEIVAENGDMPSGPVAFTAISWGACPKWSSGWVLAPIELVQDSLYDLPTLLARIFAARFARGIGAQFVTTLLAAADSD